MFHTVGLLSKLTAASFNRTGVLGDSEMLAKMGFERMLTSKGFGTFQAFKVCFLAHAFVSPRKMIA